MGKGFTDLHSHVLAGVDDGAQSIDVSLHMLKMAVDSGTTHLVATPHYIPGTQIYTRQKAEQAFTNLQQLAATMQLPITLVLGHEAMAEEQLLQDLKNGSCLPLGNTKTVLVEMAQTTYFEAFADIVSQLQASGYTPILAHPERMTLFQKDFDAIEELITAGCLMQVNAGSLTGLFGKEIYNMAHDMVKNKLVHVVASDAHTDNRRHTRLDIVFNLLAQLYGEPLANQLVSENPYRILVNKLDEVICPIPAPKKRWSLKHLFYRRNA